MTKTIITYETTTVITKLQVERHDIPACGTIPTDEPRPSKKRRKVKKNEEDKLSDTEAWAMRKKGAVRLGELYGAMGNQSKAMRVNSCAQYLLGMHCQKDDTLRIMSGIYCHDRLCPVCGWRRARKLAGEMKEALDLAQGDGYGRYILLTLTCQNVFDDELAGAVDAMLLAVRELLNPRNQVKTGASEYSKNRSKWMLGYVRSLEITRHGMDGTEWEGSWHPHVHVLLHVGSYYRSKYYMSREAWAQLWRIAADLDYDPIVDVRSIEDPSGAAREIAKYLVKASDWLMTADQDPDDAVSAVAILANALKNRRVISCGGTIRAARKQLNQRDPEKYDDVELSDPVAVDEEVCPKCGGPMEFCQCMWVPAWMKYDIRYHLRENE